MSPRIRIAIIVLLTALVIITGLVTVRRAHKNSNDFDTFYNAGRAVLQGEGLYYTGEYYENTKNEGPFLYPPFAALVFVPISILPMGLAAFLWNALNIALFLAALFFVLRILNQTPAQLWSHFQKLAILDRLLLAVMSIALLLDNLTMAQINVLVFFLCVLTLWLERRGKPWIAGLILAAAVLIKLTPLIFCVYFLIKRRWRILAAAAAGFALFTLLIPTLVFGPEQNRIYHRQWAGRTLKPSAIRFVAKFQPEETHPLKQKAVMLEHNHLTGLLAEKNQSLQAGLMRLFLKDRVWHSYNPQPIYVAHRYEKLPVLFGGVPKSALPFVILLIQSGLGLYMVFLWLNSPPGAENRHRTALEMALAFFSMTLFPPLARSHQFVAWMFGFMCLAALHDSGLAQSARGGDNDRQFWLKAGFRLAVLAYCLQGLPYGKAAGAGMWANLILWLTFAAQLKNFTPRTVHESRTTRH